ncbi:MAG: spermidine/putrescine ABC transporter substrate-binding protein [Chloroflexi bacterium]|nr:MAG: spermidine/putrescine ABC transporter substrate-binding protein [Chloroflexota bacterium]
MRKWLVLLSLVALLVSGVAVAQDGDSDGEGSDDAAAEIEPWVCPEGFEGQTLSVFNWSTYIADNTIPDFEEACGVTVTYDIYESGEAMLARIRQGNPGYDIIVPSDFTIAVMANEGLLIPIDLEKIPNFEHVLDNLKNPPYDPENQYSVPYQWGTVGIGYNTEAIPDGISSWMDMFNYEGNVAWLDDQRAMFGIALTLLGYDPNTENPDEIMEAQQFLIEHGANVVTIAADDGQVWLERGDVDMTVEYSGDIIDMIYECECETYAYVIPEEGSNIWIDNLAIPIDAPNPELAMVFMDYILHPQVGADISNFTAYASPNGTAIEMGLIDEELLNDPASYPPEEILENLFWITDATPEVEQMYNDAWDELLIFVGQE